MCVCACEVCVCVRTCTCGASVVMRADGLNQSAYLQTMTHQGYYGGKGIPFFWTTIPGAGPEEKDGALAKQAFINHKRAGEVLTYLVPLHVGAVGFHVLKGHKILARMNPFL